MDSTLLSMECLDAVIETALSAQLEPDAIADAMKSVDEQMILGMEGGATLDITIPARIHIARDLGAPVRMEHFEIVAHMVSSTLTQSVIDALAYECSISESGSVRVSIVSGGPQICVDAAVAQLKQTIAKIDGHPVHFEGIGNQIYVTEDGSFDTERSIIRNSKVEVVRSLGSNPAQTIMIGDGSTDFEVYEKGAAFYFIAIGFWVARPYLFDKAENPPLFQKVKEHSQFAEALHTALHEAQK